MNANLLNWFNTPKGKLVRLKLTAATARKLREAEAKEAQRARNLNHKP